MEKKNCDKSLCKTNIVCVFPPTFKCFMDLILALLKVGHTCALLRPPPTPRQSEATLN